MHDVVVSGVPTEPSRLLGVPTGTLLCGSSDRYSRSAKRRSTGSACALGVDVTDQVAVGVPVSVAMTLELNEVLN